MTIDELRQLIGRSEGETLDFKEEGYDIKKSRNAFIKDVLSMANTPRDQPAHIVLGVRWTPESGSIVIGLQRQFDDAQLQDAFGQDRVQPVPRFIYTPFEFEGKQVGVVEIAVEKNGPFLALKDFEGLQAGTIYYRRGTQNARAVGSEAGRVLSWFQSGKINVPLEPAVDAWRILFDSVQRFETGATYLLAADRVPSSMDAPLYALGLPPWRAVIDFDPDSEVSGLLNAVAGALGHHRVIHRVVLGTYDVQPEPGTHWFFSRGLAGLHATLSTGDHRSWVKQYKREFGRQLERIAGAVSPAPVKALILWSDAGLRNHLRTLMEELNGAIGDALEIILVSNDEPSFAGLAEEAGATFVPMNLRSLCHGLAVHCSPFQVEDAEEKLLPSPSGAPVKLEQDDWLWISEDLELIHSNIGVEGEDGPQEYRLGADISWRNLHLQHDCDRDITPLVQSRVEEDLRRRQTVRINVYHSPGSGGTTLGSRVAWNLRGRFPIGILKRCAAHDTADRIGKVAALTESSVLVVVDGGQHSARDIDDLYDALRAGQTPAVVLQVLRRFSPQQSGSRQFWLGGSLTTAETDRFRDVYTIAAPHRREALARLARGQNDQLRNALSDPLIFFVRDHC